MVPASRLTVPPLSEAETVVESPLSLFLARV
jgi:hypothetical protein